jgi:dephospho-CoA kinase
MILGLTGSFGSGKSTVAAMLTSLGGGCVIDADKIARGLQMPGQAGFQQIVATFGEGVVGPTGELDRRKLAGIVFGSKQHLQKLNAIIHPLVLDEEVRLLNEYREQPLCVLMVPLLFETGTEKLCDKVTVVSVTEDERLRRLSGRDNLTDEQIRQRLTAQMPQKEKERLADFVIENTGTLAETEEQVRVLLEKLGFAQAQAG